MTPDEADDRDLLQRALDSLKRYGADQADVLISGASALSVACRLGEIEELEHSESRDIGLRAIVGQSQAFVSASGGTVDMIDSLAERAVAMARNAPPDPYCGILEAHQLAQKWDDLDLLDTTERSVDELTETVRKTEDTARQVDGITNSEGAGASWARGRTSLATSQGFFGSYETSSYSLSCAVLAGTGAGMERDYASHSTRHAQDLDGPEEIGLRAAERSCARLNPRKIKSQKAPVVFDQRVSASLVGHLLSAISGSAVARGTSFLRNDLGKTIMSSDITIIDDPLRRRGLRSAGFDGEGALMQPLSIVENGELCTWLLDYSTAKQLGLASNARAGRGIGGPPSPSASNVHLVAGSKSPADMYRDIGTGLLVTELAGMGVNGVTGDYSRGASGFWIENGEIAYAVSEITIASNLREMFKTLIPASDLNHRRGVDAPSILIPEMTLAGL